MIERPTDGVPGLVSLNISSLKAAAAVFSRLNIYQWGDNSVQSETSSFELTQDVSATIVPGSLISHDNMLSHSIQNPDVTHT